MKAQYKIKNRMNFLYNRITAYEALIHKQIGDQYINRQMLKRFRLEYSKLNQELKNRTSGRLTYRPFENLLPK